MTSPVPEPALAARLRAAVALARSRALAFPKNIAKDELPWVVTEAYDAQVRGNIERDRRIEDERDRVLIAAVKLAETPPATEPEAVEPARDHLLEAIDFLEQAVLRFGVVNRQAARLGFGTAGAAVGPG